MSPIRLGLFAISVGSFLALGACGDDSGGSGGAGGSGGSGGSGGAGSTTTTAGSTTTATSTTVGTASGTGGGGQGSTGAGGEGGGEFIPSAETIQFAAVAPLPEGELILFNDWNASPNTVASMTPDGADATTIFEAYRVWSMGVSNDGGTIAFASGDPEQEAHYGLALGDAIQHTFLYDATTEEASVLTFGNINDECHTFSPDDASIYICRRSDFRLENDFYVSEGYDIGRIDVATGDVELLLDDDDDVMTLSPQPDPEEATVLFQWIDLPSTRSIRSLDLATGEVSVVREDAAFPVLSPDGTRFLYTDYAEGGALFAADADGTNEVLVASAQASGARWSPDGTRVVYTVGDDEVSCSHVEIVAADGSEADAPTRIRDCVETGEFITDLAWISR